MNIITKVAINTFQPNFFPLSCAFAIVNNTQSSIKECHLIINLLLIQNKENVPNVIIGKYNFAKKKLFL